MKSEEAMNVRKPSEVIKVLAEGLSTSEVRAFSVTSFIICTHLRRGRRGEKERADGFSCATTGLWRCRSCPGPFMMREWRAVTREGRAQRMPRVPRGVPSRKIPVKPEVRGWRRNESLRRARSTVSGSRLGRRTRRISALVVFGECCCVGSRNLFSRPTDDESTVLHWLLCTIVIQSYSPCLLSSLFLLSSFLILVL